MKYGRKTGATGIFIIFIMFALVIYGTYVISNINANKKRSNDIINQNKIIFELDMYGQQMLSFVNSVLVQAETKAVEYICDIGYRQQNLDEIPPDLQEHIIDLYNNNSDDNSNAIFAVNVLNRVYFYRALQVLTDNLEDFYNTISKDKSENWQPPDIHILPLSDGNIVTNIVIEAVFYHESNLDSRLTVKLDILPLDYNIKITETLSETLIEGERNFPSERFDAYFSIKEWQQW